MPQYCGAIQAVFAGLLGAEPDRGVSAGHYVHLHPKIGHVEAVNHVLGAHHQPHRLIDRHVQLGILVSVGILEHPQPLPGHHADFVGLPRRGPQFDKAHQSSIENESDDKDGNAGPQQLQGGVVTGRRRRRHSFAAAKHDHEHGHQYDNQREEENRHAQQDVEQVVDDRRTGRRRRRQPERFLNLREQSRVPLLVCKQCRGFVNQRQQRSWHQGVSSTFTRLLRRLSRSQ